MKIEIISVGKLKNKHLKAQTDEYIKRSKKYGQQISLIQVKDEKADSSKNIDEVILKEEERLSKYLQANSFNIIMDKRGNQLSSMEFSKKIYYIIRNNYGNIKFFIGGAFGFSEEFIKKGSFIMSVSKMTLPHRFMPLILSEQLFRAFAIKNNHPYHK